MQYMLDYRMNKSTDLYVQKRLCVTLKAFPSEHKNVPL